jgi:hypothetical protein
MAERAGKRHAQLPGEFENTQAFLSERHHSASDPLEKIPG